LADVGIILESKPILDKILELDYDFQVISSYHLDYDWYLLDIYGTRIAFAVSQGASMAVDLAERYIASGAKKIIRIGTIGSLNDALRLGEYIIPYAAIKDEGTSDFYLEPKSPAIADIEFTQQLSNALRQRNNIVHNGIVWSTDGRWKETDTAIARRISDGAIGTDMESSALFAFGIDRKISVASISVLSDEIHNSEGDYKGLSDKDIWFGKVLPKMSEAFETIIKVVTE
jgi:uridine phosphorylase